MRYLESKQIFVEILMFVFKDLSPVTLGPRSGGLKIAMLRATVDRMNMITSMASRIPFLFLSSGWGDRRFCKKSNHNKEQ